jgi:hypothetical protein
MLEALVDSGHRLRVESGAGEAFSLSAAWRVSDYFHDGAVDFNGGGVWGILGCAV